MIDLKKSYTHSREHPKTNPPTSRKKSTVDFLYELSQSELVEEVLGLQSEIQEIEAAWLEYVEFMKFKYGEEFEWTCEHLKKIDDTLKKK